MEAKTNNTSWPSGFVNVDASGILSWLHFGDLHITSESEQNYRDFLKLFDGANRYLSGNSGVNFAVLPGDNADDGTEDQFRLVREAVNRLNLPTHILPGDHDIKGGSLEAFYRFLQPAQLPYSFTAGGYTCLFLNSVDTGSPHGFGHGELQLTWLDQELERVSRSGARPVVFMHTYPSELGTSAERVCELIRRHRVLLVDTGHTHYNEISNDGTTIYAATRSTGQIEEGPPGFSLAAINNDVVSWKFKELDQPWPLVLITSPADEQFVIDPKSSNQVVRGCVYIHAKIWGADRETEVFCRIDGGPPNPMYQVGDNGVWRCFWNSSRVPDGQHQILVTAGNNAEDIITCLTSQQGMYDIPARHAVDNANAIGSYPRKGILGTQLGPNKNGKKW